MHIQVVSQAHKNLEMLRGQPRYLPNLPNDILEKIFSYFAISELSTIIINKKNNSLADLKRVTNLNNGSNISDLKLNKENLSNFFKKYGINITSLCINKFDFTFSLNLISLCPILKNLICSNAKINDSDIEKLTKLKNLTNLTSLSLPQNEIGSDGAKTLSQWTVLEKLNLLNLAYNNVRAPGADFLSSSSIWTNLQSLDLSYNNIGDKGVKSIAQAVNSQHLTVLRLNSNCASLNAAKSLTKSKYLKNVVRLSFVNNLIGEEGVKLLHQTDRFKKFDWTSPRDW